MSSNSFDEDLLAGESTERQILSVIQEKYPQAYKIEGYFKDYDLYVPEVDKSVEVKQDFKSEYTGNFVVETEFDGKPSALSTTKADYWVFVTRPICYWITPKAICDCIRRYGYTIVSFIGNGDTRPKKAYLIKVKHIKEFSEWIQQRKLKS